MTLHTKTGNLLDSNCQVLVNAVNCVGVAGAGLALQFKQKYPRQVAEYTAACRKGLVQPGVLHEALLPDGRSILSVPTKRHWSEPSRLDDVEAGIQELRAYCESARPASMALPALGCGLGGLPRKAVAGLMEKILSGLSCEIYVYGLHVAERDL